MACFNSAFAGVYSELLLKKDGSLHSIHLQNMLLYSWGILFNGVALFVKDRERLAAHGLFDGYSCVARARSNGAGGLHTLSTSHCVSKLSAVCGVLLNCRRLAVWLLVTNNALNGLAISAILKFANNIGEARVARGG